MKACKVFRSFILSLLLVLTATALLKSPASAEIRNRVVAIVNDQLVTLYELNIKIKELTGMAPDEIRTRSEKDFMQARRDVLDILINDKIAKEKIKELEITVSQQDVDKAIEKVKQDSQITQEDLLAKLKERGMSLEAYRENVKNELERMQLINYEVKSKIILREEEVRKYYDEHKGEFTSQGKVRLSIIFLKQEDPASTVEADAVKKKGELIMQKIRDGENFGALAKKYSQGPGADEGGDLGLFKEPDLNAEMAEIVKNLPAGGVSPLIITPNGIRIMKVTEKDPGGEKSFEQAQDAIRSILYRKELDAKYAEWVKELRKKAYTKVIF